MTQQLTLFDVLEYEDENSPKCRVSDFVFDLDEKRVRDAFGFSLVNVFFNEMTDYTSLYDLDAEERRIIGVRLQKTLEKHCNIPPGEECDFLIDNIDVEFKVIPEQTEKHGDPRLAAIGKRVAKKGGTRLVLSAPAKSATTLYWVSTVREGNLSHLDIGYCLLSEENLNKGMNRDKKRSINRYAINDALNAI